MGTKILNPDYRPEVLFTLAHGALHDRRKIMKAGHDVHNILLDKSEISSHASQTHTHDPSQTEITNTVT
jgi:hypothetical protein